jgi:hypothetical protein
MKNAYHYLKMFNLKIRIMKLNYKNVLKLFAAGIFLLALAININVSVNKPFATLSDLVLKANAQGETNTSSSNNSSASLGVWPNCNGLGNPWGDGKTGYWSFGTRTEDAKTLYAAYDLSYSPKRLLGFFSSMALANLEVSSIANGSASAIPTTAYLCANNHSVCCAIVDRYVLN